MADDTQDTGTGGDGASDGDADRTDTQPQAGTGGASEGDAGEQGSISREDARKLRSENRSMRERAKAAEAKLKEREEADLTETQKITRDLETERATRSQLETRVRELEVSVAATKLGVRPEAADVVGQLIDWTEVDVSDSDEVAKAIKAILKSKPFLAASPEGLHGGEGRGAGSGGGSANDIIRRAAGRR